MTRILLCALLAALPARAQTGRVELNLSPLETGLGARTSAPSVSVRLTPLAAPVSLAAPALKTVLVPQIAPKVVAAAALSSPSEEKKGLPQPGVAGWGVPLPQKTGSGLPQPEHPEQGWTQGDLNRVFDLSSVPGAKMPDLDMPGAGTGELSSEDVSWMRSEMVEGPRPIFSREGFGFLVERDATQTQAFGDALRAGQKGLMAGILDLMYQSLARAVDSDHPARMSVALAAARRYSEVLSSIASDQAVPGATRSLAARAQRLFLNEDVLLEELSRARQARQKLGELEKTTMGMLAPQSAASAPSSNGAWSLPEPIPESARVADARDMRFPLSLTRIEAEIDAALFKLEKLKSRYYGAARRGTYSEGFVARRYEELNSYLGSLLSWLPNAYANVTRFPMGTLRKPFSSVEKAHRVLRVPDNENLRMRPEPGGYLVSAHFETDIQDPAVLAMIKRSIEDYWRGLFEMKDGSKHFRTVVTFKTLAPGQAFSEGSLQLVDGKESVSNVVGDRLTLGRSWSYDTPAHEFGHILGLADEYRETYDPMTRSAEYVIPANLMGSYPNSTVLERQFKTAYLLLRRRSLQ